jgi:hypothetical protein
LARRDRNWSLNDERIQNPSSPFGVVPLSNFAPRGFGFVHHSIAILYHSVPNPNLTIRNLCIAVGGGSGHRRRRSSDALAARGVSTAAAAAATGHGPSGPRAAPATARGGAHTVHSLHGRLHPADGASGERPPTTHLTPICTLSGAIGGGYIGK